MAAMAPTPMPMVQVLMIAATGKVRVMAASGPAPSFPIKKASITLKAIIDRIPASIGPDRLISAGPIGPDVRRACEEYAFMFVVLPRFGYRES